MLYRPQHFYIIHVDKGSDPSLREVQTYKYTFNMEKSMCILDVYNGVVGLFVWGRRSVYLY